MPTQSLITLLAIVIAGCNGATALNTETSATAWPPVELELRFDEIRNIRNLSVRLVTIDDSRCPIGLTCVWAGQMLAVIAVTHDDGRAAEVNLRTRAGREPEVSSALGYEFSLLSVKPHPKNNVIISRSETTLRLMISKS